MTAAHGPLALTGVCGSGRLGLVVDRSLLTAALLVVAMVVLSSCSDESGELGAAEPAVAPETSRAPAGRVEEVAPLVQGIAFDTETNLLAVAAREPYRLLLLDPTTLDVRSSVELPGKARHLQIAGDRVLVPTETADTLVQVSLPGGEVRFSTKVARYPHDAAGARGGDVVVANEFAGSISLVRDGTVVASVEDLEQPGGVLVDGDIVAVVDVGAFTLSTYDLGSFERTARADAGRGPTHVVLLGGGRVAVADTRGDQILVYTLDPLEQVGRLRLDGTPYGVASDPITNTVWVTLTARNEVVGLDISADTPEVIARYPTVRQPDTVAVAPGSRALWVTGTVDGVVQRITR